MTERRPESPTECEEDQHEERLLQSALAQLEEDALTYNEAVGSFNTHLRRHRERQGLDDLPYRRPIGGHEAFDRALAGDRGGIEALLDALHDQSRLDSAVRRHPRTHAIHRQAVAHLGMARADVISTLEAALLHLEEAERD